MLEEVPLKLRDRYQFVTAPVNTKSEVSMKTIKLLAQKFNQKKVYSLNELVKLPYQCPFNESGLEELEETHKQIILYMWLR
jgi:ATP-dependent RNA helicase SUPV3L1/SUV3